jgi:hypothetical protein
VTATTLGFLTFTASAAANHATRPHTDNMEAKGHSFDFGSFLLPDGQRDVNSDLAFWGTSCSTATTTGSGSSRGIRAIPR